MTPKFQSATSTTAFMLFVILLVALALRIYQLGVESLWIDEATSVSIAQNGLGQVLSLSLKDPNPPLYYLLLHCWMRLFGDSELSVRLPSVIFGVFSAAMLYKVGALLFNRATGLISASILALSAYQVYYAQEARTYSLMVLLALASFYFFLKLFEGKDYKVLVGYVLSTTALLYSHYYGLFFVVAQALFVLCSYASKRHRDKLPSFSTWDSAGGTVAALYMPGVFYLTRSLTHPASHNWVQKPDMGTLYASFATYAGAPGIPSPGLLSLLILFAFISVVVLARSRGERAKLYLLLLWLGIPTLLPFLLSQVIAPMYVARHSIATLPALYLLAAEGLQRTSSTVGGIPRASSLRTHVRTDRLVPHATALAIMGVFACVIGFFSAGVLYDYYTAVKKEPWRDAVSYIRSLAQPDDLTLVSGQFATNAYNYYANREDLPEEEQPKPRQAKAISSDREIISAARNSDSVWLVLSHLSYDQERQSKARLLSLQFTEIDHKSYEATSGKIDLTLFKRTKVGFL